MGRLIRLLSAPVRSDDPQPYTSFTNFFDSDIIVKPYSKIKLVNCTIPLNQTQLIIGPFNKLVNAKYSNSQTNYTLLQLPEGTYDTPNDVAKALIDQLNWNVPLGDYTSGLEFYHEFTTEGFLEIYFNRNRAVSFQANANEDHISNLIWDENEQTYSVNMATSLGDYYNWGIASTNNTFTITSGTVSIGVKNSPTNGGEVYLGLIAISEVDNEIDPADLNYCMVLEGDGTYSVFFEDGDDVIPAVVAQDNDVMQIEVDNATRKIFYRVIRQDGTVAGTYTFDGFTRSTRDNDRQPLFPYFGLPRYSFAACSDMTFTRYGNTDQFAKVTLNFPNEYSRLFYGFQYNTHSDFCDHNRLGGFSATFPITSSDDIPGIVIEIPNLALECYDGNTASDLNRFGIRRSFIDVVPGIERSKRSITYVPSTDNFISINNKDEIVLKRLDVRFLSEDSTYLQFIGRVSMTLLIED